MLRRFVVVLVFALSAAALVGAPASSKSRTLQDAVDAGWDCAPVVLIVGYYHCAPPGKPSVADLAAGGVTAPSIVLQAFRPSGPTPATATFAGIEVLIRADLFKNHVPKCSQDGLAPGRCSTSRPRTTTPATASTPSRNPFRGATHAGERPYAAVLT